MLNEQAELAPDGQPFSLTTLRNEQGMSVTVMDWGATLLSCQVPVLEGMPRETLLGCASPADYLRQSAYLGASVGRYANRIGNGKLTRDGQTIMLDINTPPNQLHGGPQGFDKRRWRILHQDKQSICYALDSAAGDQGFPGALQATAHYQLTADNRLSITYCATVDSPCPVNLTNHAYFNLDAQPGDVRQHHLQVIAGSYLPVDSSGIPAAPLSAVADTSFDFREAKPIARDFLSDACQQAVKGYDHAFLLQARGDLSQPAARLWSADGKLAMTVYTTAPALQVYTGNYLAGTPARDRGVYADYAGVALESQFLPDSPNHPEWPQPDCWLAPGETYKSVTQYHFAMQ